MGELFYIMRTIKLIILCSLATYIFVACGNSATNSDNKNNYNNYREAVDANDFSAAHKMLGDLYEEYTVAYAIEYYNLAEDSSYVLQEKYYKAFETCTLPNIKKARLFYLLSKTTISMWIFKLLGIALIAFGWIYVAFVEELTFVDTLPLLAGIAYQIFYMHIKKKWTLIISNFF